MGRSNLIKMLYEKDTPEAYANLKNLEALSDASSELYVYFNEFFDMAKNEKYGVRVRGFRLLCKQSKWDTENKIDSHIDEILSYINDDKPTAVRMKLEALGYMLESKKNLRNKILSFLKQFDYERFPESTSHLIKNDLSKLINTYGDT